MVDASKILKDIDKVLEDAQEDGRREHLGASGIGRLCDRQIWFDFRWAKVRKFGGRMLRLFNRGHREEERFEEWISSISEKFWAVDPRTGKQIKVSDHHGFFGGSLDGVARNPSGYKGDYLTEFKTHSIKSFDKVVLQGVRKAKFEHFVQMQMYLHYNPKLEGALYVAIRKNDDELYIEYVERDTPCALQHKARAKKIILSMEPPTPFPQASEHNFYCKHFCDYHDLCYKNAAPAISCRTCAFVEIRKDGWMCGKTGEMLDVEAQKRGCEDYQRGF